jgi:hypothetical protein
VPLSHLSETLTTESVWHGLKPSSTQVIYGTVENGLSAVFITLGEPQVHGDTAEAVLFVEIRLPRGDQKRNT